jgi:hypothetical protein
MVRSGALFCCGLAVAALTAGCGMRRGSKDELGAKESVLPASIPGYSVPLDLREFEVDSTDGGARGVFLKLSRLPSGVSSSSESSPARIVVDIQGPTGTESPEEVFPGGDSLVTHIGVSRQMGGLRVVLDLAVDDPPDYAVYPMADWVLVRIKTPSPHTHPWAHGAS